MSFKEGCMEYNPMEDAEKKLIIEAELEEAKKKEIISEKSEKVQIRGGDENTELYVIRVHRPYKTKDRKGNEKINYMDSAYIGLNQEQAHRYFKNTISTNAVNWAAVKGGIETGEIIPSMSLESLKEEEDAFKAKQQKSKGREDLQSSAGKRFVTK